MQCVTCRLVQEGGRFASVTSSFAAGRESAALNRNGCDSLIDSSLLLWRRCDESQYAGATAHTQGWQGEGERTVS